MATTLEQARQALTTKVETIKATWADYPLLVEYYNTNVVNTATQTKPFLRLNMTLLDGYQTDLAAQPGHRVLGVIAVEAMVKEGSGMSQANKLVEFFYPKLHMTDSITPIRTYAASFATIKPVQGWVGQGAYIPFWFDSRP